MGEEGGEVGSVQELGMNDHAGDAFCERKRRVKYSEETLNRTKRTCEYVSHKKYSLHLLPPFTSLLVVPTPLFIHPLQLFGSHKLSIDAIQGILRGVVVASSMGVHQSMSWSDG